MKASIPDALLADWFTKYLLPKILCDVAMSEAVTEEDVIWHAQHLDQIYSQSGTLFDIIPHAPRPSNDKSRSTPRPHADGVIGSVSSSVVNQVARQLGQLAITDNLAPIASTTTSTTYAQSTDVNLVQTSKSNQTGGRNNCNRWKKNAPTKQSELNAKEPNVGGNKGKKKVKFPCLASKEDHFIRDCPRLVDIKKYVEQSKNPLPAMLTNPFPAQQQQMVAQVPAQQPTNPSETVSSRAGSSSVNILMADSIDLTTRAKS